MWKCGHLVNIRSGSQTFSVFSHVCWFQYIIQETQDDCNCIPVFVWICLYIKYKLVAVGQSWTKQYSLCLSCRFFNAIIMSYAFYLNRKVNGSLKIHYNFNKYWSEPNISGILPTNAWDPRSQDHVDCTINYMKSF